MITANDIKWIKSLGDRKSRNEAGLYLAEGSRLVLDLIRHNPELLYGIYATENWIHQNEAKILQYNKIIKVLKESQLQAASTLKSTEEVLAVVHMSKNQINLDDLKDSKTLFYFYQIQDPGNLGTIIRSADWFGINTLLCSPKLVDPYNNKSVQAAMSSLARVQLIELELNQLKIQFPKHKIISTSMEGKPFLNVINQSPSIVCFGNEAHGLPIDFMSSCDERISIPGNTLGAESLNVAISASIIMSMSNFQS